MGFHLENKKAGVILEGHCGQKSRFAMPAGIDVSQTGHAIKLHRQQDQRDHVAPELKPQAEMGDLESHKLWSQVTNAINNKDYSTASRVKAQIEEAQRALAKARKEKGETQADALKVFEL
ncbi:hypothetical protein BGZ91_010378, partial [Linnemannia elongata]